MSDHAVYQNYLALLCLGMACLTGQEALAANIAEGAIEHEKINTADATTVDPGRFKMEGAFGYGSSDMTFNDNGTAHSSGFASKHELALGLTAGLVKNLDVTIKMGYDWLENKGYDYDGDGIRGPKTGSGFGDLDMSARYRFYQNSAENTEVAYIGGFTTPTGTDSDNSELGTSQGYWTFNNMLAGSKDWGKWTANADIGFNLPFGEDKGNERGTILLDLAGGYQVLPWLQPELEMNYRQDMLAHEDNLEKLSMTAGLIMPVRKNLLIKTGIQQDIFGRNAAVATSYTLSAKMSF